MSKPFESEALAELDEALKHNDRGNWDEGHIKADSALCSLLTKLGYTDVVDKWRKVDKWYS